MSLSREIVELVERVPPIDDGEDDAIQQRWARLSGDDLPDPDYLPLIVHGIDPDSPEERANIFPGHIRYPLAEQIDDPEKMLWEQLVRMAPLRRFPGDGRPAAMPWFGNAFLITGLGLDVRIIDDLCEPARSLSREEIRELHVPETWADEGLVAKAVEFIRYARSVLPDHIPVGLFFMMSPYDLAYLIRGSDLMLDMYEAPDDAHHLMGVCTDLFVRATKLLRQEAGEADDSYRYMWRTFRGGGHLCEDCCVMLSAELHREFSIPYTRRALDAIGGGWVHFCGDGRHLLDSYLEIPNLHGFEFGQLEMNGPADETARKIIRAGKGLNYQPAKGDGEDWPAYFRRVIEVIDRRKGLYLNAWTGVGGGDGEALRARWHEAQDDAIVDDGDADRRLT